LYYKIIGVWRLLNLGEFPCFFAAAVIATGSKVRLPGIFGAVSVQFSSSFRSAFGHDRPGGNRHRMRRRGLIVGQEA
jgi:hypothetical protein